MKMTKLENLKQLLEMQIDSVYDIHLQYSHLEITKKEQEELISIINATNQFYNPQILSIDGTSNYDTIIVAKNKNSDDEYELEAQLDEEVAAYEAKVETEEDERDEKERIATQKESKRKMLLKVYRKRKDNAFYDEWSEKLEALKNLIPTTENHFKGKGRDKKFKAEYRRQGKLLFHIIKNLNLEGY